MWLDRILQRITDHPGPVVLEGGENSGVPFILLALTQPATATPDSSPLIWVDLRPNHANDFIAQGNALADAVNSTLGATLLPHALPYSYGVDILKGHHDQLGPYRLAVSHAEYAPTMTDALLSLTRLGSKVLVGFSTPLTPPPKDSLILSNNDLALSHAEAKQLASSLEPDVADNLWRSTGGAYTPFVTGLARLQGRSPPLVPTPSGDLVPEESAVLVSPEALLTVLCRASRFVEALELAVMSVPHRVADIIAQAGPHYQQQGLLGRLNLLLESLDETYQQHEAVLEWRLVAATAAGETQTLLPVVEAYLIEHEAPQLRARYATDVSDPAVRVREAERAARHPTPLTLWQYGRLHPDPVHGIALLRESVRLAEVCSSHYEVARNAGMLGQRLIHQGHYHEAAHWTEWAVSYFRHHNLKDGDRYLRLYNDYAYARVLTGHTAGLGGDLRDLLTPTTTPPDLTTLLRSTLADLELALGNPVEAEILARANLKDSPRRLLGYYTITLVRALLEQGNTRLALSEAQRAVSLTKNEAALHSLPSLLALGMSLAPTDPAAAQEPLTQVLGAPELGAEPRCSAALHLLVTQSNASPNLDGLPADVRRALSELAPSGLRLLSGPEATFSRVWAILLGQHVSLDIRLLGTPAVWFRGELIPLSRQLLEVLALIALSPTPLSADLLQAQLFGDTSYQPTTLRTAVYRLRQHLPISAAPYRIEVAYRCDVMECHTLLAAGRTREALEHYRGPLLPYSDAPTIREAEALLEAQLRQAALASDDPDVLMVVARQSDDIELYGVLEQRLAPHDARLPLVRARLRQLLDELEER